MKTFLFIFLFTTFANFVQAQISDDDAKQAYQDAEEQYENANFYKCAIMCSDLVQKMEKPTPKVLYLLLKSIYKNLESDGDKSGKFDKSYKSYSFFSQVSQDFFKKVDKNTYPPDKYQEIVEINNYFEKGLKEHESEKDRKPEDAINFLNECAQKFTHKDYSPKGAGGLLWGNGRFDTKFSIDSNFLKIDVLGTLELDEKKYNKVGRERIQIDLSKVWIDYFNQQNSYHSYQYFFLSEFGESSYANELEGREKSRSDQVLISNGFTPKPFTPQYHNEPIIVSSKTYINNEARYSNILWYYNSKYDKKVQYSNDEFEKEITMKGYGKQPVGFDIYSLFDQTSEEFKGGNYAKRILEAFKFLIEYYGGGTPFEDKQENRSKF